MFLRRFVPNTSHAYLQVSQKGVTLMHAPRNSYFLNNSSVTFPRRQNKRRTPNVVEPELHTIVQMADNRTMEELLQAPTEGYGEAIVILEINADHFEIKTNLLQLVQPNPYHGFERENPHTHINNFKRITSTLKFRDVPNDNQSSTSGTLPSNTIPNLKGDMKAITTRSGVAYEGPSIPTPKKEWNKRPRRQRIKSNQISKYRSHPTSGYLNFETRYALLLMPKFASTIKSLLTNKDKLFELAKIPLNKNCSAMLLKKLPEKLGDPGKLLIPFVDFEASPRVPLILGRSFLRTSRALIDVYGEEITLGRGYAQEILGFSNNSSGGNPTLTFEPIIFDSFPSLTPFEGSDFVLEEIDAYLKNESVSPKINHADCDPEGDICLIEKLLNDDPFQLHLMDLKQGEVVKEKFLIEEPPELELKDLPSHLEYAYLEGADKLPVIISKDLKVDEKETLLKVLKSHKRAIA
uniref:Reverse transcriptase domain-containing protein n=1 Tax=Tanacetum cinerariifolium TaxID=118510 RepID=A0A699GNX2_TANCI|nr:reverse transcriptase domain-containing protein [Tanacetum cinerariifolium]